MSIMPKRGVCFSCGHDHGDGSGSPGLLRVLKARGDEAAAYQAEISDLRAENQRLAAALEAAEKKLADAHDEAVRWRELAKLQRESLDVQVKLNTINEKLADSGRDAARLDWLSYTGAGIRRDPDGKGFFLDVPYHTGISSVDDYKRFAAPREAIDAAMAAQQGENGGEIKKETPP